MLKPGRILAAVIVHDDLRTLRGVARGDSTMIAVERSVVELWDCGWSDAAIARELSIGVHRVRQVTSELFHEGEVA